MYEKDKYVCKPCGFRTRYNFGHCQMCGKDSLELINKKEIIIVKYDPG